MNTGSCGEAVSKALNVESLIGSIKAKFGDIAQESLAARDLI